MAKGALDFSEYDALDGLDVIGDLATIIAHLSGAATPDNKGKIIHSELFETTLGIWEFQQYGSGSGSISADYRYGGKYGYRIYQQGSGETTYCKLVSEFATPPGNTMGISCYVAANKAQFNTRIGFTTVEREQYRFIGLELDFTDNMVRAIGGELFRMDICELPGSPNDCKQFIPIKLVINIGGASSAYESCVIGSRSFRICYGDGMPVVGHGSDNIQAEVGVYRDGVSLNMLYIDNLIITCSEIEHDVPCEQGVVEL